MALRPDGSVVLGHADRSNQTFVAVRGARGGALGPGRRLNGPADGFRGFSLDAGRGDDVAVLVCGRSRLLAATLPRTATQVTGVQRVDLPVPGSGSGSSLAAVGVDWRGNAYGVAVSDACELPYCANPQWRPWTVTFDAAAPSVEQVVVPRAGRVGDGVRLRAVGVHDLASAVTATWWFSDGTTRTGLGVGKVLRRPGRLVVRLVLGDRAGHRTVRQTTIVVTR